MSIHRISELRHSSTPPSPLPSRFLLDAHFPFPKASLEPPHHRASYGLRHRRLPLISVAASLSPHSPRCPLPISPLLHRRRARYHWRALGTHAPLMPSTPPRCYVTATSPHYPLCLPQQQRVATTSPAGFATACQPHHARIIATSVPCQPPPQHRTCASVVSATLARHHSIFATSSPPQQPCTRGKTRIRPCGTPSQNPIFLPVWTWSTMSRRIYPWTPHVNARFYRHNPSCTIDPSSWTWSMDQLPTC